MEKIKSEADPTRKYFERINIQYFYYFFSVFPNEYQLAIMTNRVS